MNALLIKMIAMIFQIDYVITPSEATSVIAIQALNLTPQTIVLILMNVLDIMKLLITCVVMILKGSVQILSDRTNAHVLKVWVEMVP